jgi:hypothetical protein
LDAGAAAIIGAGDGEEDGGVGVVVFHESVGSMESRLVF